MFVCLIYFLRFILQILSILWRYQTFLLLKGLKETPRPQIHNFWHSLKFLFQILILKTVTVTHPAFFFASPDFQNSTQILTLPFTAAPKLGTGDTSWQYNTTVKRSYRWRQLKSINHQILLFQDQDWCRVEIGQSLRS